MSGDLSSDEVRALLFGPSAPKPRRRRRPRPQRTASEKRHLEPVAPRDAPPITLDELVETFRRYLYLPDTLPLCVVLAAVAANRLPGDPVWLLLVGPPSSGKTELLNTLDDLERVWRLDVATEAGLMTTGRDGALGGVLGEIMETDDREGIVVVKDLSTVLAEGPTRRAGLFADLRRIYDGEWERALGKHGGTQLRFEGKVGLLGAATDAIDRLTDEIGDLGPRMLLFRMPDVDADAQLRAAGRNVGHQADMRAVLADAVERFLAGLDFGEWPITDDPDIPDLRALASWAAWCRSAVVRDRWGEHQIEHVPRPEPGARLYAGLLQLTAGAITIRLDDMTVDTLVRQVALDSIPAMRRRLTDELLAQLGRSPTTRTLGDKVGLPTRVVGRVCEDLAALGVLERSAEAEHGEHHWSVSDEARSLARRAGLLTTDRDTDKEEPHGIHDGDY
ncbi:MAG: hypothetical protein ACRDZ1_11610 [Acidimicrobiia bacterium]